MSPIPSSSPLPSSFDPAVHLHSEFEEATAPVILPSLASSDDIEALHLQQAELTAAANKKGIVIQHRAWGLGDAFRSEEDHPIDTPTQKRRNIGHQGLWQPDQTLPSSSPPPLTMPLISSPIAYPPGSSPPAIIKKTKVFPKQGEDRLKVFGGFIVDEEEDDMQGFRTAQDDPSPSTLEEISGIQSGNEAPVEVGSEPDESLPRIIQNYDTAASLPSQSHNAGTLPWLRLAPPTQSRTRFSVRTCAGSQFPVPSRRLTSSVPFEQLIASRSVTEAGRATKSYYGINIHALKDEAAQVQHAREVVPPRENSVPHPSVEEPTRLGKAGRKRRTMMWTEKYRARRYCDLIGDERTHRAVLGWIKSWDPIVFPGYARVKPSIRTSITSSAEPPTTRKILLLTGAPGLGKTTLAHVCARQAGYEVLEINASDERSRNVVKGRIRDIVGTESVKTVAATNTAGKAGKAARPVCVVLDEVDGAVSGVGAGGEGGFIKALVDLVLLDQKTSAVHGAGVHQTSASRRKNRKSKDGFRLLRPIILICNDLYHPSLRPLRQSSLAQIVHVRKPLLSQVIPRMQGIFENEGFKCDRDGVRRLCEAAWGITGRRESISNSGNVEGDIRGVLVVAEWVAAKLRASCPSEGQAMARLTREWVEKNIAGGLSHSGTETRGVGRGGVKEAVERVFLEGAGFQTPNAPAAQARAQVEVGNKLSITEMSKRHAMQRLRELVDSCGEIDRVITDCFAAYPNHPYRDDSVLSKPNEAYDWLHFHDCVSSRIFSGQEWELSGYMCQSVLAFHSLFSTSSRTAWSSESTHHVRPKSDDDDATDVEPLPFTGPRADFSAQEAEKHNRSLLSSLQSSFSLSLGRSFKSAEDIATELLPYVVKLLSPDVKPTVVGGSGDQRGMACVRKGSEQVLVRRAVSVMTDVGVAFERTRLETDVVGRGGGWVYRMDPPLDALTSFETAAPTAAPAAPVRYAVRQVLDQEYRKELLRRQNEARQARYRAGGGVASGLEPGAMDDAYGLDNGKENESKKGSGAKGLAVKRDFFGRIINEALPSALSGAGSEESASSGVRKKRKLGGAGQETNKVWVSYHEGFSNAVRKPITLEELMRGM